MIFLSIFFRANLNFKSNALGLKSAFFYIGVLQTYIKLYKFKYFDQILAINSTSRRKNE